MQSPFTYTRFLYAHFVVRFLISVKNQRTWRCPRWRERHAHQGMYHIIYFLFSLSLSLSLSVYMPLSLYAPHGFFLNTLSHTAHKKANRIDADQTVPNGTLWSASTLFTAVLYIQTWSGNVSFNNLFPFSAIDILAGKNKWASQSLNSDINV